MNKPRKSLKKSVPPKLPFRRKYFLRLATGALLLVWTSLYLPNLGTTPRWYGDETITLSCGQDLVHGIFANRATWNTFMNPQFCYQPGYVFLVGLASTVSHKNIAWPRFLNALCALGIAWIALCVLGRRFGIIPGLSIGLLFLTYEQSVIHFRWVYPHNAVALGLFICFCFQTIPNRKYRSWLGGVGLAIAAASHPLAVQGGLAAFLNRWNQPRTWLPLFLPPLAVGLLSLSPIFIWKPNWLIHDIFEPIALATILIAALLTRNRQNLPVFYYQAVVILPLLSAGIGYALIRFFKILPLSKHTTRWLAFILPVLLFLLVLPKVWTSSLIPRNDPWVVRSTEDHQQTISWLIANTATDDLVLCNSNIGWRLNCKNADFLMLTAWEGYTTFPYIHGLKKERFRFDIGIADSKYLVFTNIDRIWTMSQPNVQIVLNDGTLNNYIPVFVSGECIVLGRKN